MSVEIERAIGRLEALVASHGDKLDKVEVKVDRLCSAIDQAKGGWKVGIALATAGGALGAAITKLSAMLWVMPR